MEARHPGLMWGAIAAEEDGFTDTASRLTHLHGVDWNQVQGFVFHSAARWSQATQVRLVETLAANPRPVLVGNPDLVAPAKAADRGGGLLGP